MLLTLLFSLFLFGWQISASHFRYLSMSWQQTATLSYDFAAEFAYRADSMATTQFKNGVTICPDTIVFGDGTTAQKLCGLPVNVTDAAGNIFTSIRATASHTYAEPGQHMAFVSNCCRLTGQVNGGAQSSYRGYLNLTVGGLSTKSPQIATTTTHQVAIDAVNTFALQAADGSGPLTCLLTTTTLSGLVTQPQVTVAGGKKQVLSITPDCVVTWDLTGYKTLKSYFGLSLTVIDQVASASTVDFVLLTAAGVFPTCAIRGIPDGQATLTVEAGSPAIVFADGSTNVGAALNFAAQGLPLGAAFVSDGQSNGLYTNHLNYTPTEADIGKTLAIPFTYATVDQGLQCAATIYIRVVGRPARITTCGPAQNQLSGSDSACTLGVPDFTASTAYSGSGVSITQSPAAGSSADSGDNPINITVFNDQSTVSCLTTFTCTPATFQPAFVQCPLSGSYRSSSDKVCDVSIPDYSAAPELRFTGTAPISITQSPPAGSIASAGLSTVVLTAANSAGKSTCNIDFECKLAQFSPTFSVCPSAFAQTSASDQSCTLGIPDFTTQAVFAGTSPITLTQDPAEGSRAVAGLNTVTLTATNSAGSAQCSTSFTCALADFAPSINQCASTETQSGAADYVCKMPDFSASSDLAINGTLPIAISQSIAADTQVDNGTAAVTLTVSNDQGSASCEVDFVCALAPPVEMPSIESPKIIKCPDSITQSKEDGKCTIADFISGIVANGTAPLQLSQSPVQGSAASVGTTNVSILVDNPAGRDRCETSFVCALADYAPIIQSCPEAMTAISGSSLTCDQKIPAFDFAVDGSSPLKITQIPPAGSIAGKGTTLISLEAENNEGSVNCQTSFTCELPVDEDERCRPYFSKMPDMAVVDLFSDYSPAITGTPVATSPCSNSLNITHTDRIFGSPACSNALAIHRLWVVTDDQQRSSGKLQMIGITQPRVPLFGGAAPFQLYATGSMKYCSSFISGQAASACDLTAKNTNFGLSDQCTYTKFTLVGDKLKMDASSVFNGIAAYSKQYTTAKTSPVQRIHHSPLDFADIQSGLRSQNKRLAGLKGKIPATNFGRVFGKVNLKLAGSSPLFNIFCLSSAQLAAAQTLQVQVPADALVLVNVAVPSGTISWPRTSLSTLANNVLFNFYGTSKLSIKSGTILGSILAPATDLTFGKASLSGGQIAAQSIDASGLTTTCGARNYLGNMQCDWHGGRFGTPYQSRTTNFRLVENSRTRRARIGRIDSEH